MALTYSLAPNPKWYFADLTGRPLAAGYIATFSSLDKTQLKPVFQTASADFVWPYVTVPNVGVLGILIDENGTQGPFYFESNSADLTDTYYIEVYDRNGVLQWTIDDFTAGGGSGGSTTTNLDLENLVANNVFWRNIGTSSVTLSTNLVLAPGANAGIVGDTALAATTGSPAPDITFIKSNAGATDQIIFTPFPLGVSTLTGDVTPVDYLRYTSNAGGAESFKCIQLPITSKVQNLSNQNVTVTMWGRLTGAGADQVTLYFRQFYGSGGSPSADQRVPIATYTLTSSWQKFTTTTTIPDATGKTLGDCGNDALFIQLQYPLNLACDLSFTKPCVYLGNIVPDEQYSTYDMIDGVVNTPRTGDIRMSLNSFQPFGWVPCNDGTIGSETSGATTRANLDTFPLYKTLWDNVSNTYAPVSTGRGATAIADFSANKTIGLTKTLGRALASVGQPSSGGSGTTWALGQTTGEELHTLTISEMPSHAHPGSSFRKDNILSAGGGTPTFGRDSISDQSVSVVSQGDDTGHNTIQPTVFYNVFLKL